MVDYMHPQERPATVFGIAGHKRPQVLVVSAYFAAFLGVLSGKGFSPLSSQRTAAEGAEKLVATIGRQNLTFPIEYRFDSDH